LSGGSDTCVEGYDADDGKDHGYESDAEDDSNAEFLAGGNLEVVEDLDGYDHNLGVVSYVSLMGGEWDERNELMRSVNRSTAKLYHKLAAFAALSAGVSHRPGIVSVDPQNLQARVLEKFSN
jgi:hypothetical protein